MDGGVVLLEGLGLDDEGSWRSYCCALSTRLKVDDVDGDVRMSLVCWMKFSSSGCTSGGERRWNDDDHAMKTIIVSC